MYVYILYILCVCACVCVCVCNIYVHVYTHTFVFQVRKFLLSLFCHALLSFARRHGCLLAYTGPLHILKRWIFNWQKQTCCRSVMRAVDTGASSASPFPALSAASSACDALTRLPRAGDVTGVVLGDFAAYTRGGGVHSSKRQAR